MKNKLNNAVIAVFVSAILLLGACETLAQADSTPTKRLKSPVIVRDYIGGEAHNTYVIRVRKGQTMTVQISWQRVDDNKAEFTVSESPNFFNGSQVAFGKASDQGKRWRGRVPRTANYYIYVVAHPTAHYTLRVKTTG